MLEALSISAFSFSLISFGFSLFVFVERWAEKKSQHVVQMVPVDSLTSPAEPEEFIHPPSAFEEFDSPRRNDIEMAKLNDKLRNL